MVKLTKQEWELIKSTEYEWVGNFQRGDKSYKVFRAEMNLKFNAKNSFPTVVLRLTPENNGNGYIFHQRGYRHRTFRYLVPEEFAQTIIYQFL